MIRDSEFDDNAIRGFIQDDTVGRNQYLNSFLNALVSVAKNTYISVDADWGAGKTVFMKQIEYLSYCSLTDFQAPNLENRLLESFQEKYVVFYYNAWEHDHHEDALQSLLFSVIDEFYTEEKHIDKVNAIASNAATSIMNEVVKLLTKGIIDVAKIKDVATIDDLVGSINAVNERKGAVSSTISRILPEGKKLLFIVDELDRCKPEFAVHLMEVIKHYYNDDNMVFILSTNNRQLRHTVKKYYGQGFDGYGYLDKMYDLILELPPVDMNKYFEKILRVPDDGYFINMTPIAIAKNLNMTMREANRYFSLISFIQDLLVGDSNVETAATHYIFIPYALGLRVKDIELYDEFINGKGENLVRDLFSSSDVIEDIISRYKSVQNETAVETIVRAYLDLVNSAGLKYDFSNRSMIRNGQFFRSVMPLIANIKSIDGSKD